MPRVKVVLPEEVAKRVFVDAASSAERMARLDAAMERALAGSRQHRLSMMQLAVDVKRGPCVEVEVLLDGDVTERFLAYAREKNLRAEVLLAGALLAESGVPSPPPHGVHAGARSTAMPQGDDLATADELERFARRYDCSAQARDAALRRSLEIRERLLGPDDEKTLAARHALALWRCMSRQFGQAIGLLERNLATLDAAKKTADFPWCDQMLSALAVAYRASGRADDSERTWRRLVETADARPDGAVEPRAEARWSFANSIANSGRYDEALRLLADALRLASDGSPWAREFHLKALYLAASVLGVKGDLAGAEQMHQRYLRACVAHRSLPMGRPFRRPGA